MNGKLGSLHTGRLQIGGVLDWQLALSLTDTTRDAATYYKMVAWKLTASAYWLFDVPQGEIVIRLYRDGAMGYWEGRGIVSPPANRQMDTLIHMPLEIIGEKPLEGHE